MFCQSENSQISPCSHAVLTGSILLVIQHKHLHSVSETDNGLFKSRTSSLPNGRNKGLKVHYLGKWRLYCTHENILGNSVFPRTAYGLIITLYSHYSLFQMSPNYLLTISIFLVKNFPCKCIFATICTLYGSQMCRITVGYGQNEGSWKQSEIFCQSWPFVLEECLLFLVKCYYAQFNMLVHIAPHLSIWVEMAKISLASSLLIFIFTLGSALAAMLGGLLILVQGSWIKKPFKVKANAVNVIPKKLYKHFTIAIHLLS